jgi:hypothetical protein
LTTAWSAAVICTMMEEVSDRSWINSYGLSISTCQRERDVSI